MAYKVKQNLMNNPFIKNNRTGFLQDKMHRSSHYMRLLRSKPAIDNKLEKNYLSLLTNPKQKEDERSRVSENMRLMRTIIDIDRNYTRYMPQNQEDVSRKKTLKNTYREKEKELVISKDNANLYRRMKEVESEISNDKMTKFDQQATRYAKLISSPVSHITSMDQQFFDTYRHQVYRIKTCTEQTHNLERSLIKKKKRKTRKLSRLIKQEQSDLTVPFKLEDTDIS